MALNQNQKNANLRKQIDQMDKSKLRTKRKPSRFFVENEYVHGGYVATLPTACSKIYYVLSVHCNNETQVAFPSISTIQEMSGCTNRNTTLKAIATLQEYGIIGIIKTKGFNMVNVYAFQATRYWKPIPGWKEKMDRYKNKAQYQFTPHRSNKREEYRSNRDDTLTNLRDNSPNNITSIKDVLKQKMQEMGMPIPGEQVAIQEPSLHSVVGPAKHEPFPVIAGNLREPRSNTSDTAINEDSTVKKGWKNGEATPEPAFSDVQLEVDERTNNMGHNLNDQNIKSAYEQ
jgi:hypothetical protein